MTALFSPLTLRGVTARNRLWVSPMCQYSAVDGIPQEWHHTHLVQFASGGAGLVVAEASAVSPEGRITREDVGIWTDEQRDTWRPIVDAIRSRGALAGIQLAHAGRKASTRSPFVGQDGSVLEAEGGWPTVGPSAIAFDGYAEPAALDAAGIERVVADFLAAAARAVDAGFQVIEIHAAHGYLLHQFLSPLSNLRGDEYGGSLENRARLLLRIVRGIRDAFPDIPLFVRFSGTDWAEGGLDTPEVATVAGWAAEVGADLADISSGGLVAHQRITVTPGYQVPFAAQVRRDAGIPVSAVGLITDGAQAQAILDEGEVDAIMAGREWLRDPHFALRAASELGVDVDYWPVQYARARRR